MCPTREALLAYPLRRDVLTMTHTLVALLAERGGSILAAAATALTRAHLPHYERAGTDVARERLRTLLALVERCAQERHLGPILQHAEGLARERQGTGVGLGEVQTAINVLE